MGVPFRITLYAADQKTAQSAADAAFARVEALNGILSDYDSDSELSRTLTHFRTRQSRAREHAALAGARGIAGNCRENGWRL